MWLALALAVAVLAIVVSGSLVTTNGTLAVPSPQGEFFSSTHRYGGMVVGALALALFAWQGVTGQARGFARTLCAAILVEGWTGISAASAGAGLRLLVAAHATLAHVVAAAVAVAPLMLSPAWTLEAEPVRDYGWPSMRSLAIVMPVLVAVQVALGAAFRQQALGLMPHIAGAMVVSLLILIVAAFVLHQFPKHPWLRPAARVLMVVTFVQVFLGLAAFTVRSLPDQPAGATLIAAASHVGVGALTLTASVVLSALIRRHVLPKA